MIVPVLTRKQGFSMTPDHISTMIHLRISKCLLPNFPPRSRGLFVCFEVIIFSISSFLLPERHGQIYTYICLTHDYKNTSGIYEMSDWILAPIWAFPEPETQAPCPWPNFKCLVIYHLKAMAPQSIIPMENSQFPRVREGNQYLIPSAFTNGNLGQPYHAGASLSKHERIQHKDWSWPPSWTN